jgi:excisionase family DNA binding protein
MARLGDYYTIDEAARELGLSFWQAYRPIKAANVPTVRVGKSLLVKLEDVRQAAAGRYQLGR